MAHANEPLHATEVIHYQVPTPYLFLLLAGILAPVIVSGVLLCSNILGKKHIKHLTERETTAVVLLVAVTTAVAALIIYVPPHPR